MSKHRLPSEINYLQLFSLTPGPYLILKPDAPHFTIVEMNNAYARATITKKKDIFGKGLFEVFPDNPNDPHATGVKNLSFSLNRVIKTKKPNKMAVQKYDIPIPSTRGSFEVRYWSPTNIPVLNKKGEIMHIIHAVIDVTEIVTLELQNQEQKQNAKKLINQKNIIQKQFIQSEKELSMQKELVLEKERARALLMQSEQRFRTLADNIPNLVWMANTDGYIYWYNSRWYEYTGKTPIEMEGWGWQSVHDPKELPRVLKAWKESIKSGKSFDMVFPLKGFDGVLRPFLTRVVPIKDQKGKIIQWFGTNTDITEQIRAKESLRESEERFRATFHQSAVAMSIAELDGKWITFNDAYPKMFGYSAEELKKMDFTKITHPSDVEIDRTEIKKLVEGKIKIYSREKRYIHKNGNIIWGNIYVSLVRDEKSNPKYIIGVLQDVTERKRLEKQKDEFLGIASHELKTPVTSIKAYTQVLQATYHKKGDEKSVEQLGKMDAQLDKLTNLIGDLLDITKIEAGKLQFHQDYFDFNLLINEVVEELQRTTKKHTLIKKLGKTKKIFGDKERVGQVITNIISNAIKYSPHSQKIIISTKSDKDNISLCVEDFGVGIPKEKQNKVFEQFFRVSGPKENTFPGLGLGLYVSSEIIKRQGGKIWVNSIKGKGSTFCFSLPINKQSIKQERNTSVEEEIKHE